MVTSNRLQRIERLRAILQSKRLAGLVVTYLPNIRYLTGFSGSNAALLVTAKGARFLTDGRYTEQAQKEVAAATVEVAPGSLLNALGPHLKGLGSAKVGIEADYLTLTQEGVLRSAAGGRVRLVGTSSLVEDLRAVKNKQEIADVRRAANLICRVWKGLIPLLRPRVRELDIAAEADYQMRKLGASGPSFETIVASGPRTALPHARPTMKRLQADELVLVDMGAILGGYCSDLTRSVYLGRVPDRVKGWYRAVQEANAAASRVVRPGATTGGVDQVARHTLARFGLDRYFTHSTGHGIGLEIHEAPRVAKGQSTRLQEGNIITIEPGIYMPGFGGIRIEDDVLVTRRGAEVLTRASRELLQL